MQNLTTQTHSHDPLEMARIGNAITNVERYNGIEPHSSRVAHFQKSSAVDRYFWYLGRGGASPVRALTPSVFLDMFENWALSAFDDCESDLMQANANIKAHAPKAALANDESGDFALHYEYSIHRANLELLHAKLKALPLKKGAPGTFANLDWSNALVDACVKMFCETLRATTIFSYSDAEIEAALHALRGGEINAQTNGEAF